ncbi:MAG: ribonuclease 3 [Armatimonadota bacterium]|nr:MAG: ribonuclease 3 [Armatimonadota bacterium]
MEERQPAAVSLEELRALQQRLGVEISDLELLRQALTHRSFLGETTGFQSNERLEFLGDSVLGLVVAEYLYHHLEGRPEGDLSRARAVAVSEPTLAEAARSLDLQSALQVSTGERLSGGLDRDSILSDTYEAVVAVIYLDRGLDAAREFVLRTLSDVLHRIEEGSHLRDFKSQLQQLTQARHRVTPRYHVVQESGADHDKTFVVEVEVNGKRLGRGVGKSKKQAEQAAAEQALSRGLFMDAPEEG